MTGTDYTLVIGDKNYSSWSLRPWLALKACGVPFKEERVQLRQADSKAEIFRHSPSGKVPALKTDIGIICDSLAIVEYLAEQHPEAKLWPTDREARAAARSVSAEMHAGFQALRNDMPMDLLSELPMPELSEALENNIRRVVAIWQDTRARFGKIGPFLLGDFTNADAMYAPVATRFRTYGVKLERYGDDGTAGAYVGAIYAMPAMAEWTDGARTEMRERAGV
ncbi:MAG: glutathione S-transferase family protein [Methyloceanibacter sp.]|jgi:glutathione S-transferase|uniref:glutathione S-transferase family protein n=1 Tax=Methyloceanibacter sp. TaxID=1965321 RepID=UPI00356B2859